MIHIAAFALLLAQVAPRPVTLPRVPPVTTPVQLPPAQPPQPTQQTQEKTQTQQQPAQAQAQGGVQVDMSASARPYQATLVAMNGSTAQVKFADGSSQSYTVAATAGDSLNSSVGKTIAFRVVQGTLQVAGDVKWATLAALKNGVATLRDATNATTTLAVDSATQTQLQGSVGKKIAYTVKGTNQLMLASDQAPPKDKR